MGKLSDRGDVRSRRSSANRHADSDEGQGHLGIARDLALLHKLSDDGVGGHSDIDDLTVEDAPLDLVGRRENENDLVATISPLAGALESAREFG
jgi:hypothetical protein